MDHQKMWVDSHFTIWAKGGVESTHRYIYFYIIVGIYGDIKVGVSRAVTNTI